MGRKKDKWTKKTINFYRYIFKFDLPFNILIDGNFVAISIKKKFDIKEKLEKFLGGDIYIIITSCVFTELQQLEPKIPGMLAAVSKYKIQQCDHGNLDPLNCIRNYIGKRNKGKFFVASQDQFLRVQLRKVPGVPLVFFDQNILLIDKISRATLEASERREGLKEDPQKQEKKDLMIKKDEIRDFIIEEMKETRHYKEKMEQFKINKLMGRIRKKAKGPNPLSVKTKESVKAQRVKDWEYKEKIKKEEEEEEEKEKKKDDEFIKKKRNRSRKRKKNNLEEIE